MSGTSAGFGLKYKGSRDSGTSGSHGSRSHSLLIFQTESGRGSTHLLEFSLIPPIIIYPGEYEKWWCEKILVKVASLVHTLRSYHKLSGFTTPAAEVICRGRIHRLRGGVTNILNIMKCRYNVTGACYAAGPGLFPSTCNPAGSHRHRSHSSGCKGRVQGSSSTLDFWRN